MGMLNFSLVPKGVSALSLKRYLGVSYHAAWLAHHKLMEAMFDRETNIR
jgi:hypothetical protein